MAEGPRNDALTYNSPEVGPIALRLQAAPNEAASSPGRLLDGVVTYQSRMRSDKAVDADAENPFAAMRQHTTWIGVNYRMTPALTLIGGALLVVTDVEGDTGTLVAAGANYSLSKQTMFFVTTGRVRDGVNGVFPVEANAGRPPVGGTSEMSTLISSTGSESRQQS